MEFRLRIAHETEQWKETKKLEDCDLGDLQLYENEAVKDRQAQLDSFTSFDFFIF